MHDIILICVCVLVTMLTRFLPFLIFRKKTPRIVTYLGTVLPCAIMGMLVVYCMKDVTFLSGSYGIPEILCYILTAGLHVCRVIICIVKQKIRTENKFFFHLLKMGIWLVVLFIIVA